MQNGTRRLRVVRVPPFSALRAVRRLDFQPDALSGPARDATHLGAK
jgi:hypothetical protein